jgi:hypothetical protein
VNYQSWEFRIYEDKIPVKIKLNQMNSDVKTSQHKTFSEYYWPYLLDLAGFSHHF